MHSIATKARELEELQKGMSKKVNPKVVNMIERYAIHMSSIVTRTNTVLQC